ncbi:MAG: EamA family transporter [bacterium]
MSNWQLVLLAYFIVATASSLQRRVFAQKTKLHPTVASLLSQAAIIVPLGIIWALIERDWFPNGINVGLILTMAAAGLFQSLYNILSLKCQKEVDATQFAIIANLYTPITIIGATIVLHEGLTAQQAVGMILLVLGAVIVSVKGFSKETLRFSPYTWIAFGASLVLGLALIAERGAIRGSSIGSYFVVGYGIQTLASLLFALPYIRKSRPVDYRVETSGIFWLGLLRFGQFATFALASSLASNVSLISSVTTFKIVFIFIASYLLLKERDHAYRKMIGILFSIVGLLLT